MKGMELPNDFSPPGNVEATDYQSVINWFYNGKLFIYAKPDIQHSLDDAKKQVAFIAGADLDEKVGVLLDIRKAPLISFRARKYYGSEKAMKNVKGICLLINSPIALVVGNFYFHYIKKKVKTKMVNSASSGIEWLDTL